METVIVSNSQFYSHYPRQIPKGSVNAEQVEIRLDKSWDGLTVRIHWLNVASNVERKPLLERDQPNTIPWEVLTDLGELRMGLVGMDGDTVIKPTIWLTYGYVVDGVDPEAGSDPQPPTPSWEQQMVGQATAAANAAKAAKDAAVNAEKAASQSGPYADEAKKSAEAAKEAQRAASTSAQEAGNAKDQANTASNAAKVHADAAGAAKVAAERAAETAGNAQSDASQSAQAAANSAQAAERAKQEAQDAAATLPAPSKEFAGKAPIVNPEGTGYIFGEAGSGGAGGELLLAEYIHQGNQEIRPASIDWETGVMECTEPHGLTDATEVMISLRNWPEINVNVYAKYIPVEWSSYQGKIHLLPVSDTSVKIVGADKNTPISVNASDANNASIDVTKIQFEIPVGWSISNFKTAPTAIRIRIVGFVMPYRYRFLAFKSSPSSTGYIYIYDLPSFGSTVSKHLVFDSYDISIEPFKYGCFTTSGHITHKGRPSNQSGTLSNTGVESINMVEPWGPTAEEYGVFNISNPSSRAVFSNGTIVRVYAKGVR